MNAISIECFKPNQANPRDDDDYANMSPAMRRSRDAARARQARIQERLETHARALGISPQVLRRIADDLY